MDANKEKAITDFVELIKKDQLVDAKKKLGEIVDNKVKEKIETISKEIK
jgi:hypothetical protein